MKKKHNLGIKHLRCFSPTSADWFRIEDTAIVSNGELAFHPYVKILKAKGWSLRPAWYAEALNLSGFGRTEATLSGDVSELLFAKYFNLEDGRRALVNEAYLQMLGDPEKLTAVDMKCKSYGSIEGNNFDGVLVDDADNPSFWIAPIQEAFDAIHVLQRMVAGQAAARAFPSEIRLLGDVVAGRPSKGEPR